MYLFTLLIVFAALVISNAQDPPNVKHRQYEQDLPATPCKPTPCGPSSVCADVRGTPVCSCEIGYIGSPPSCRRPECTISSECPEDKTCINEKCVDACIGVCGVNALCHVIKHSPVCSCGVGTFGDPFVICKKPLSEDLPASANPCQPSPCGPNSACSGVNGNSVCSCKPGYIGSPPTCAECVTHSDCAKSKACINEKCADPCEGTCGTNARCNVINHTPTCYCEAGFIGDPFTICSLQTTTSPSPDVSTTTSTTMSPQSGNCILPPYPNNGHYTTNIPGAEPGQGVHLVVINVTCHQGFGMVGSSSTFCHNGFWPTSFPKCVKMCELKENPTVEYRCLVSNTEEAHRPCGSREPSGTIINPLCRKPNYYYAGNLYLMHCVDGEWNYIARCTPECGKVTPDGKELVVGGSSAKKGELPWHAGIYKKSFNPYMQVCGGSLISNNIVISAAHCFWTDREKQLPASLFAVAVGKLYRPWNNEVDEAQKSDVKEIILPPRFQGSEGNFQDDIAAVIVTHPFEYKTYIRPVCLSFEINIDRMQPQDANETKGKVAGWGLTGENGNASTVLQVVDLPYVEVSTCIANLPYNFREYITSDKICAGTLENNTALCRGDSGGGLAFPIADRGALRYYLHGVVSTAPNKNEVACDTTSYTTFTQILKHEFFIKLFWND